MAAPKQNEPYIRDELVTQCLSPDFSYPNGLKIIIKWNNIECNEENGCSSPQMYLPSYLIETGI